MPINHRLRRRQQVGTLCSALLFVASALASAPRLAEEGAPNSASELARAHYLQDRRNPFSMNYRGTEAILSPSGTLHFVAACQLADTLGRIERVMFDATSGFQHCVKSVVREGANDHIEIEVLADQGQTEAIAVTIRFNRPMAAKAVFEHYEPILQHIAFQFSQDSLPSSIAMIETGQSIAFTSTSGGFVGVLSLAPAYLEFSYSR